VIHKRALDARRANDEVDLTSRFLFEGVYGFLNDRLGNRADVGLHIRHKPLMRSPVEPVNTARRFEYCAEPCYFLIVRPLNGHERALRYVRGTQRSAAHRDLFVDSVDGGNSSRAVAGYDIAGRRRSEIDNQPFNNVFNAADRNVVTANGHDRA